MKLFTTCRVDFLKRFGSAREWAADVAGIFLFVLLMMVLVLI